MGLRRGSTAAWIVVLAILALLSGLSWASMSCDALYLDGRFEQRSCDPTSMVIAVLMAVCAGAAGASLVCYVLRRPLLAARAALVSAVVGLPAVLPAAVGVGVWLRIRSERVR